MNETLPQQISSLPIKTPLSLSPKVSTILTKDKPPFSSNSFAECGAHIINTNTPHFPHQPLLPHSFHPKKPTNTHTTSHSSDHLIMVPPKPSQPLSPNLNNITIYNLEVFNVNSDHLLNQNFNTNSTLNNTHSLFPHKRNVSSFFSSPKGTHKDEVDNSHLVSRKVSKDVSYKMHSNKKLSNFKNINPEDMAPDIKKVVFGASNCTNIQKTSKYGKHLNISNIKKLNTCYSFQSGKSPRSMKKTKNAKLLNILKMKSLMSRKTKHNSNEHIDMFINDINGASNINNSHSQLKSIVDSFMEDEDCSGYDDDDSSPYKRSMNRLHLTNIFNPFTSHNIAPSELNAVSQISENDKSNIFIRPTNTFFNRITNSNGSSVIRKTSSFNKTQYHHSKTNKCYKRNRQLGLSSAFDMKTCISCGFISGNSAVSKQLADFMESIKQASEDNQFIVYDNELGHVKGFSAFTYKNMKKNNEDKLCISIHCTVPNSDASADFFGIYDGHGGAKVAEYLAQKVHVMILNHSKFLSDTVTAIRESIACIESEIINENINLSIDTVEKSGACLLLVVIVNEEMFIANIGDSRAIIGVDSGMKLASLTIDHKPNEVNEEKRILQCGGKIEGFLKNDPTRKIQRMVYRTNPGFLSVSRSIGDIMVKIPHFCGKEHIQSAIPDIFVLKADKDIDFILLASDGIFDELTNNDIACEVYHTAKDIIESEKTFDEFLRCVIINLMKYAIEEGSKDNLSIIFIAFDELRKNIEKKHIDKINTAITRLENTVMDGDKLYSGIDSKHLYIFDKSELKKDTSTVYGSKVIKGHDTSFLTAAHNKSMISLGKIDCFANSKANSKIKLSFMSRFKEKMCCGFFA